ncbi:MAG: class I adenylate-forming enzyme family protein [Terracidiphilus sp.]
MHVPQFTLEDYERDFADRHLLHGVVAKWAKARPEAAAIVSAGGNRAVTWSEFDRLTTALAAELLRMGFATGDFLVTLLPFSVDHVLLEYSCFKIGVIVAPLDLRLSGAEVIRALEILRPRAFVSLGVKATLDLRPLWRAVKAQCPWIEQYIVMDSEEAISGTQSYESIAEAATRRAATAQLPILSQVAEGDGALVIFTTGSTGSPKPALLSHRNITVQNMCLCGAFFGGDNGPRTLVNLPPSHVGGQTEAMMSTFFGGGTAILLDVFDAGRSLRAIPEHRVEILGQIPAMFNLEWMLKEYGRHDLSSLKFAAYGGHAVSRAFVEQLAAMSPVIGTGLGLTEAAGWCTYVMAKTDDRGSPDSESILAGLGVDMPIYPCTIRQPMREDGSAGDERPFGEIGHLCFRGPQTFLGYVNDPAATAQAISRDGYLYTGDLGFKDAAGLHLTGREKWVIKSFGYQIFPGDVEKHICMLTDQVANCVVVGVAHEVVSEAVVAVVEKKPNAELSSRELDRHARGLPTYMRPRHWIIVEAGQIPLNRIGKPDYVRAQEMARAEIALLRARGEWDSAHVKGAEKEGR